MLNRANLTKAGRVAVYATQTIGVHLLVDPFKGHSRRIPNHQRSLFYNTKYQTPPSYTMANEAPPNIVILRTVTAYRVENFGVNYKIINNVSISIPSKY